MSTEACWHVINIGISSHLSENVTEMLSINTTFDLSLNLKKKVSSAVYEIFYLNFQVQAIFFFLCDASTSKERFSMKSI